MSTVAPSAPADREHHPATSIGVDIGSTNTKVALLRLPDNFGPAHELGVRSFRTPDAPGDLVATVLRTIRGLTSTQHRAPVAVGIASMAESGVVLDGAGRPVGPVVRWTAAAASALFDTVGPVGTDELYLATGVPPAPKVPLATWHRLRSEEPDRWRQLARWAGVADYVAFALTGELTTDHTLAGRTMAYRLPPAGSPLDAGFDDDLLALAGLSAARMPRVLRAGEPAGSVAAAPATASGLAPGTPVYIAGHDHAVAAWASGVRDTDHAADSLGTTEALLRVAGGAVDRSAAHSAGMSVTRTVAGDRECLLAGASGGVVIGRWVAGHPEKDAEVLFRELELEGPGDAFLLPYPRGRQTPHPNPAAREHLVGTTETAAENLRAVLVGLCLQLRWMAETQNRILGSAPTQLTIVGGAAAHNAAWNRLKARLLATPLAVVGAHEPVASGAALLAAVRIGAAPADAVLASAAIPPHPHPRADDLFRAFVRAATSAPTPSIPASSPAQKAGSSHGPAHT